MANTDHPNGFTPIRHRNGAPYNGAANFYIIPTTESNDIGIGHPVVKTGSADSRGRPYVTAATAGDTNAITGVVVAFEPTRDNLSLQFYDASAISVETGVWVCDDPDVIFVAQDDASATLAATNVGQNANVVFTHGVNTTTGRSGAEIDATTPNTTSTFQLKILRLHDVEDNEIGANARWEVMINNHTEAHATTGI